MAAIVNVNKARVQTLLSLITSAANEAMVAYELAGHDIPSPDSPEPHPLDSAHALPTLRRAMQTLHGASLQLCSTLALPVDTLSHRMDLFEPACLRVVYRARVADTLLGHPTGLHVNEIAKKASLDSQKLSRVLHLLTMRGWFTEVIPNVFANNRLSLSLLSSDPASDYLGVWVEDYRHAIVDLYDAMSDPEFGFSNEPTKSSFMYSVRDEIENGVLFDWYKAHPDNRERFGRGMAGWANMLGSAASINCPIWSDLSEGSSICDVGSGVGAVTIQLAKAHPHLKFTLCDLPDVVDQARRYWDLNLPEAVKEHRVEFLVADFFKSTAVGHDCYYLKHVIHDWHDKEALTILKIIRGAMRSDSRIFIQECVLPHQDEEDYLQNGKREDDLATKAHHAGSDRQYNLDITMLVVLNAKERTLNEFRILGAQAGLDLVAHWPFEDTSLLEFRLRS